MNVLDSQTTVGQLVREQPARARVFESLGLDYCCGGKLPLAEACRRSGVDLHSVLRQLDRCDADSEQLADGAVDADAMTLTELADHIQQTHHAYLKDELPRLDKITLRVAQVHGDHEPRLRTVRSAFEHLRDELVPHMMKEEIVLFPLIRQLERSMAAGGGGLPAFGCGSIAAPIRQMESEHDDAGDALAVMREQTDGFAPPAWACNTYREMLRALLALEHDMHQHVHKENNILFPKAIELERR